MPDGYLVGLIGVDPVVRIDRTDTQPNRHVDRLGLFKMLTKLQWRAVGCPIDGDGIMWTNRMFVSLDWSFGFHAIVLFRFPTVPLGNFSTNTVEA